MIIIAIFADKRYYGMRYELFTESVEDIMKIVAGNAKRRRLEKGWTRKYLYEMSGVPVSTIAKFERDYTISLASYISIAKALGYSEGVKKLMSEPLFSTMSELNTINSNKNRRRGYREKRE